MGGSGRSAEQLGGAALILGGSLVLGGNLLHPRIDPFQFILLTTDQLARVITGNLAIHYVSHTMLAVGPVIWLLGFLALHRMLVERGERTYSLPAILCIALSTVLLVVVFVIDGFVDPVLAQNYLAASPDAREPARAILEYSELVALTFLACGLLTVFVGGGLFGASLLKARLFNRWLGWVGVALGLIGGPGYAAGLFGPYWLFSPLFAPFSLAFTVWVVVLGISLFRGRWDQGQESTARPSAPAS